MNKMILSAQCEETFEWMKWTKELPFLSFPSDWDVQITPPSVGAIVRFRARKRGKTKEVSVYFDAYNLLGHCGGPYWEAYPIGEDTGRWSLGEESEMIAAIDVELAEECRP
jgi:hypothetical protein